MDSVFLLISLLENKDAFTDDMSPLFMAIRYHKENIVEHLLAKGVNLHLTNSKNLNAIHFACQHGNVSILQRLVDQCKDISILEKEGYDGWRPIHMACYYNTVPVIEYLMRKDVIVGTPIRVFRGKEQPYLPINLIELNQNINEKALNELIANMIQMMEIQQLMQNDEF